VRDIEIQASQAGNARDVLGSQGHEKSGKISEKVGFQPSPFTEANGQGCGIIGRLAVKPPNLLANVARFGPQVRQHRHSTQRYRRARNFGQLDCLPP
jgi:hypothetical protein